MPERHAAEGGKEALPGLFRTLVYVVWTAFRSDRRIAVAALGLIPLAWLTGTVFAWWLKLLVDAALDHDRDAIVFAVAGLVISQVAGWASSAIGRRLNRTFREKAGATLETELIRRSAGTPTIQHLERPEYLDKLDPLRKETWIVHWTLESLAETLGVVAQTALTIGLLASVHPALVLLPVFGVPALLVGRASAIRERSAQEAMGEDRRRQRHLVNLGTNASPGKEIRVFGLADQLLALSGAAWRREHAIRTRVAWLGAGWQAFASAFFAVGFVGALLLVAAGVASGQASVGDFALALVLAATMSANLRVAVGMFEWLVGCLAIGARYLWLVDHAREEDRRRTAQLPGRSTAGSVKLVKSVEPVAPAVPAIPARLRVGIEVRDLSFRYPGTPSLILDKVSLTLPAGSVVAFVGDNGAGKTTFVKLLCGMYEPTEGGIFVDGHDLAGLDLRSWRERCTGAFQDHARFELALGEAVMLGDLRRRDDPEAAHRALAAAGAADLAQSLPDGLRTQLGATWPGGTELSGGQWQKVALARGLMREEPLLTVLDEPTASLDAQTEDTLFARYAAAARRERNANGVTLLVSHRFSTVRSADHIVVLSGGTVVEYGTHDELIDRAGTYAELYELQARGYR
ncbi:ABC transporter ATP-binding protein [Actinopolymorpha alba]|uniref:ABC transporter ATP-binding protein n=1 Tax=Actinopolymorpha alba TaxID=533267 RepID=UPI00036D89C3|nr:ABC transporter ATP-binding protein [Actinopolymorpha alba]